jgi:hypothetical protein
VSGLSTARPRALACRPSPTRYDRGASTLIQATAVADRWGTRHYGALSGVFAAPMTTAMAVAPWAGTAAAAAAGGYPEMFAVFAALAIGAAALTASEPRQ